MNKITRIIQLLFSEPSTFLDTLVERLLWWLPDDVYLKLRFRLKMGERLNLKNPKTFNEKLQWLKLYNRKPEYTTLVDKYAVKEYVATRIGNEYIIPTIGVWDSVEDIEWNKLPDQFVLKTTHGGGGTGVVICNEKNVFDKKKAIDSLKNSMKSDIYRSYREWPYKNVPRKIIAEQYMTDADGQLKDYKFFCFNGEVKFFKVDFNRFTGHRANYYSAEGVLQKFGEKCYLPDFNTEIKMPENIETMISLAEQLSKNIPFLRVDFYNVDGKIFFGEMTFFPAAGMGKFEPEEWDTTIGDLLTLPIEEA
ncbi:MAG: hypothetical protein KBT32_08310 [Bacteroidales bacterium]|nr:hypothetical protein [Candidatus Physcocola equi]